ncbi:low-density lipoprotein receptor-related protein 4-like [Anneissia japonica]|uniref:low-density lipoprotein receptor-related protein 4-like n=1 Tax=Anneissia japonica TaxID=1529436 RepID=UPI0014258706|nr:low-density lipoprotein receptor-related protein 4-like [Anneissia japonica]
MSWLPWLVAKEGDCPTPKGFGICVDMCTSDYSCTGSLKCCSNGCGHVCMEALIEQDIIFASTPTTIANKRYINDNAKNNAVALDYDFKEMQIYWSDVSLDQIYRTNIDGTGVPEVLITEASIPDGISIDWVYRNIYWTDTGTNAIEVASLENPSKRTILISDNLDEPRAITIEPRLGYMFWTDWGQAAKIERAGMNGEARVTLVDTDISWPNGLTTDLVSDLLFWVDGQRHSLSSIDYNGQSRRTILQSDSILPHPFAITVFEDYVYWTDWQKRAIIKANKSNGSHTILVGNLNRPTGIQIYHPQKQINGIINHCGGNNGRCSYLCVAAPQRGDNSDKFSCLCPTNSFLMQDGRTCEVLTTRNPLTPIPITISPPDGMTTEINEDTCNKDYEFTCGDGRCISIYWRCDFDEDCDDGSDERGCLTTGRPYYTTTTTPIWSHCYPNPCENGVCKSNFFTKLFHGGYKCECYSGYSGKHCEEVLSPCHPNPCKNGVCISNFFTKLLRGGYKCKCDSGYSGKHCEEGCKGYKCWW